MSQPSTPSLDDLLARAEDLALFSMRTRGQVHPAAERESGECRLR